jgi:hypothetical protein
MKPAWWRGPLEGFRFWGFQWVFLNITCFRATLGRCVHLRNF